MRQNVEESPAVRHDVSSGSTKAVKRPWGRGLLAVRACAQERVCARARASVQERVRECARARASAQECAGVHKEKEVKTIHARCDGMT